MPLNPNKLLKYGLKRELRFLYAVQEALNNDEIVISKTENEFECVDFDIYHNTTKRSIFIELKSRKGDISNYNSFFIDQQKLLKISVKYTGIPVILVWTDEKQNLFYTLYDDSLLDSEQGVLFGNKTLSIKKDLCHYATIKELADDITSILSNREGGGSPK